jgi:hypothetical protein
MILHYENGLPKPMSPSVADYVAGQVVNRITLPSPRPGGVLVVNLDGPWGLESPWHAGLCGKRVGPWGL